MESKDIGPDWEELSEEAVTGVRESDRGMYGVKLV